MIKKLNNKKIIHTDWWFIWVFMKGHKWNFPILLGAQVSKNYER